MTRNQNKTGMTGAQIGILAGLAGTLFVTVCLAVWLIFGDGLNVFARAPSDTPTPDSTATLIVIPTRTPTITPTPIPYEQLIPRDWVQRKTALIEIHVPAAFKVSSASDIAGTTELAVPELILSDASPGSSVYDELIVVSFEPLTGDSLDSFLDGRFQQLDPSLRMVERRKISMNGVEAVRSVIETRVKTIDVNVLVFVFLHGGTVWYVEYAAQINEFYESLSVFEQSAQTFRVVK